MIPWIPSSNQFPFLILSPFPIILILVWQTYLLHLFLAFAQALFLSDFDCFCFGSSNLDPLPPCPALPPALFSSDAKSYFLSVLQTCLLEAGTRLHPQRARNSRRGLNELTATPISKSLLSSRSSFL